MRTTTLPTFFIAGAFTLAAATAQEAPFQGAEEVTAVDVVMELDELAPRWLPGRQVPSPADLVATADDAPVPVVAVQPPAERLDRLVIYLDLALSDDYQLTWAALHLADRSGELVELAQVEVVVADPEPRTIVSPTRDAEALDEALARLAFLGRAQDRLVELRLAEESAAEAERELIRDGLDALLLTLVDRSDGPDPRRAVLLASGGFEVDADPALREAAEATGRAVAAYGWRVVPLLAPDQPGPIPGRRIGKWRFLGIDPGKSIVAGVPLFGATREEDRDPELAEAHLELAKALRAQGELERAADEAESALLHFAGDPRTADRQAATLVLLGEVWEELGDPQRSRRAYRRAARFDPETLADHPVMTAAPDGAVEALAALAAPGGGTPARSDDEVGRALAELGRRAVVTVQIPGSSPEGELRPVEVTKEGSREPTASGWLRYGTPRAVTEARARRRRPPSPPAPTAGHELLGRDRLDLDRAGEAQLDPGDVVRHESLHRLNAEGETEEERGEGDHHRSSYRACS